MVKTHFLAVDPGIRYPAAAIFDEDKKLLAASRVKLPGAVSRLDMGERCREVGRLIAIWTSEHVNLELIGGICIEWPQIYTASKSKGDPNNLTPLAGVGVAVATIFHDATVVSPVPREWIGQVPKSEDGDPWASPRGQKIRRRLTPDEIECIVISHDAIDAVGLGLWALGRLDRIRVFHKSG